MTLLNMLPCVSGFDFPYYSDRNSVGFSKDNITFSRCRAFSDFKNLYFIKLSKGMFGASFEQFWMFSRSVFVPSFEALRVGSRTVPVTSRRIMAFFSNTICSIQLVCSKRKMLRITTKTIVAGVHNYLTSFGGTNPRQLDIIVELVRKFVSFHHNAMPTNTTITAAALGSSPFPTIILSFDRDICPEVCGGVSVPGCSRHD